MSLHKLELIKENIIKDLDVIKGKNISQPLLKLGYNYELNELRNKYDLIKDKEYQIKINNDMNELTNKYLNKDLILSNVFYKYWELFVIFKILNEDKKNILLMNDYDTNIYNCLINFKEKIYNKKQDDITIYNINKDDDNKFKNVNIINNKNKIKDKNEYDIIICNTDINVDDINYKEQYLYELKLFELITVLKNQKKGGIIVFKYYDIFTISSIRFINILQLYYENVYVYNPKIENKNSDKFIVCVNYKGLNKTELKHIENIYKDIIKDNNLFLLDLVNKDVEDNKLYDNIRNINIENNVKIINNIKNYIHNVDNNDMTEILQYRNELNKDWINKFYPVNEKELNILRNNI